MGKKVPVISIGVGMADMDKLKKKMKKAEGAYQKQNGKWTNKDMFPGRDFDDLDAYRAAKKQRAARRDEYRAQARAHNGVH